MASGGGPVRDRPHGDAEGARRPSAQVRAFVGRDAELAVLAAALTAAEAGRPSIAVLAGEPGIGKTRTTEQFHEMARSRGANVVTGRCYEGPGAPSYWPWTQLLRGMATNVPLGDALAGEVSQLIGALSGDDPGERRTGTDPAGERFFLFTRIAGLLVKSSRSAPAVLTMDDLHCGDEPSLLLLQFVASQVSSGKLLFIGTFRDTEVSRSHPLARTLAELARHPRFTRIPLRGLGEPDVARLVEAVTGRRPGEEATSWLRRETDGNPFFVAETARLLAAEGWLSGGDQRRPQGMAVPQGIRDVIGSRLNALSPRANDLLSLASVIGREFAVVVLSSLSRLEREEVVEILDEASAARLVVPVAGSPGRYTFAHSLIRETLYQELTTARRIKLHREVGEVVEAAGVDEAEALFQVAHHFVEAASSGGGDKALRYVVAAAERATQLFAYEEASILYKRALEVLDLTTEGTSVRRCRLLLALGESQMHSGEFGRASESFVKAADVARAAGQPECLARAAIGLGTRFDLFAPDAVLVRLLEEALKSLSEPSALKARVMGRLSTALMSIGRVDERTRSLADAAVEMARASGDRVILAYVISAKRMVVWGPTNLDEHASLTDELLALADETRDPRVAAESQFLHLINLLDAGRFSEVPATLESYHRCADAYRNAFFLRAGEMLRAHRALFEGRLVDAEEHTQRAGRIAEPATDDTTLQIVALLTVLISRERGDLGDETVRTAERLSAKYPLPAFEALYALVCAEGGNDGLARSTLDRLASNGFRSIRRDMFYLATLALLSEVAWHLKDEEHARALYDILLPYEGRFVVLGAGTACLGPVALYLGMLAAILANRDAAESHLETALRLSRDAGSRPYVARSEWVYGTMLLARGRPDDRAVAARHLLSAELDARRLGMLGMFRLVQRTSQGASVSVPTPPADATGAAADGVRQTSPARQPLPRPVDASEHVATLQREGEFWTVARAGNVVRVRDTVGMRYICHLVSSPGTEILALDLEAGPRTRVESVSAKRASLPATDARSMNEYRRRLRELNEDLEEALACNDIGRAEMRRHEIEALADELARVSGLGGRIREAAAPGERARVNVTRAIRTAIATITRHDPALGRHLANSVRTGTFCSYSPDPSSSIRWML